MMEAVELVRPDRPIPARTRVLGAAVTVSAGWALIGIALSWWMILHTSTATAQWLILIWVVIIAGTRLAMLWWARRRPRVAWSGALVAADAREHSLRTRALPEDPRPRVAAAADSCRRIEAATESLVPLAGLLMWSVVLPLSWVAGPSIIWAVGQVVLTVRAVRSWRYLGMLKARRDSVLHR